jgi:hypothetical protein
MKHLLFACFLLTPLAAAAQPELDSDILERLTPEQTQRLLHKLERRSVAHDAEKIVVPVMLFGSMAAVGALALWLRSQNQRRKHDMLRGLIEKGAQIPPEFFAAPEPRRRSPVQRGVFLLLGGAAFCIALYVNAPNGSWTWGLIPVFTGLGTLVAHRLEQRA